MEQRDAPAAGDGRQHGGRTGASEEIPRRRPAGRYGKASTNSGVLPGRILAVVLVVLVVGLLVAAGGFLYEKLTSESIDGDVVASDVASDSVTTATVDIHRSSPDQEGYCILRAKEYSGAEVGRAEVYLPPGGDTTRAKADIATTARGYVSDIYGCQYGVPPYMDRAAADGTR